MPELPLEIPCFHFSAAADGSILQANAHLYRSLGYDPGELQGTKLEKLFTFPTRIFLQTHLYPLLQLAGHADEIYITLKSKTGAEVPLLINAMRTEGEGSYTVQFVGIAVPKRKKFEEEIIAAKKAAEKALQEQTDLKAAKEELQNRAEELDTQIALSSLRNQELNQFNHLATHTFQEPLRKLLYLSGHVLDEGGEQPNLAAMEKIQRAARDMDVKLKGLQQYLWLSNETVGREPVQLQQLVAEAKDAVAIEHPAVPIVLEMEHLPIIEANKEQLFFLMKELMTNAVRFRKAGAAVNIHIYASTVLLNLFRELPGKYKYTDFLKFQVQDNGVGMDGAYQHQAFELFRTLHPNGGSGIGLALCRKIVENHLGSMSLESKIGAGMTVSVFLPLQQVPLVS